MTRKECRAMRTSLAVLCTIPCAALVVPDRPAARVDARDHAAIEAALDAGEPFIAAEALSARDCEAWTDALMMQLGDAPVRRQRRGEALEMPLGAFFEDALTSSHASPSFLFDEFLLDGDDDLRGAAVGPQRAGPQCTNVKPLARADVEHAGVVTCELCDPVDDANIDLVRKGRRDRPRPGGRDLLAAHHRDDLSRRRRCGCALRLRTQ